MKLKRQTIIFLYPSRLPFQFFFLSASQGHRQTISETNKQNKLKPQQNRLYKVDRKVKNCSILLKLSVVHSIVFVWSAQIGCQHDQGPLQQQTNTFGAGIKIMWEEQLVDTPIGFIG